MLLRMSGENGLPQKMIGCDLHAAQQTLAILDSDIGETYQAVVRHDDDQVRAFYTNLAPPVLVGLEANGSMWWYFELLDELGIAYRVGTRRRFVKRTSRKQKHGRRDATLLLRLHVRALSLLHSSGHGRYDRRAVTATTRAVSHQRCRPETAMAASS